MIFYEPSWKRDRAAVRKTSRKKEDDKFCRPLFFGLVLSERFSAQTSHFCSAPPLGCGTFHRFERLVWASLHLSERSRTIEVRVTTLSAQTCTKSLTQSYMVLPIEYLISVQSYNNGPHRSIPFTLIPLKSAPCLLVIEPSPKIDRAARMWASRHKISDGVLPSEFFVGARS